MKNTKKSKKSKKCQSKETEVHTEGNFALSVLKFKEAYDKMVSDMRRELGSGTELMAALHAIHAGMFISESKIMENATRSMEDGNGSSGERDD